MNRETGSAGNRQGWIILLAVAFGVSIGYVFKDRPVTASPEGSALDDAMPRGRISRERSGPPRQLVFEEGLNAETRGWLQGLRNLAADDPDEALKRLAASGDSEIRPLALAAVARGWARKDPLAAAKWIEGLEASDDQVSAALGLVPEWCVMDRNRCLEWTDSLTAGDLREMSQMELADAWTSISAREAFDVFSNKPAEAGVRRGLHAVVCQWAMDDPQAALNRISAVAGPERRDELLETALVSLSTDNPELAWSETDKLSGFSRAGHVREVTLEALAESRPQEAIKLAGSMGNPPELLSAVASGWSSWDAPGARAWVDSIQNLALRQSLQAVIGRRAEVEP